MRVIKKDQSYVEHNKDGDFKGEVTVSPIRVLKNKKPTEFDLLAKKALNAIKQAPQKK